ncbi:glycosyltransferase family 4 protein [Halanaerobaculum tunisiense]
MKRNILFINHTSKMGGGENSLYHLINKLNKQLFNPIVICPKEGELTKKLEAIGIKVKIVKQPSFLKGNFIKLPFKFRNVINKINKIVKEEDIDVVHANSIRSSIYASFACENKEVPTISHIRVTDFGTNRIFKTIAIKLLNMNDKIIVVSETVKKNLINFDSKLKDKIVKVYNGIELELFDLMGYSKSLRKEYDIPEETILIGMVGRIAPWKGHKYFIEAASIIKNEKLNKEIKFVIVGDILFDKNQVYKEKLKQLVSSLNLSNDIIFAGFRNNIPDIMSELDIFVLPSDEEPFGRVLIEAMAAKTPVIATRAGGPIEIIDDKSGRLIPPKSSLKLSKEMIDLIINKEKRINMGFRGRKRVEKLFSLESHVNEIQSLYFDLLKKD